MGVAVWREARTRMSLDPHRYGEAPPPRCLVAVSFAATRRRSSSLKAASFAPVLDIGNSLSEVSPSDRVDAVAARRPQLLCSVATWFRSVAVNPLPDEQRSSLLLRQPSPPPRCLTSEFLCLSDRAVSKDTYDCGGSAISPPIAPPPHQRPPLGLLHDRAGPGS